MNVITRFPRGLRTAALIATGAVLLTAFLMVPAAAKSTPKVENGGTVTVGIPNAPDALDPTTEDTFVGRIIFTNMCQSLYGINTKMAVIPVLATALPVITAGGLLYTIHLRKGVKFNDGTAMTAGAVKTSLLRMKNFPTSAESLEVAPITSITVVNNLEVQLHLSEPDSSLTSILSDRPGIVMSPTALTREGANFSQDPVCVGPFAFKSRPSLNEVVLTRSHDYYGGKPHIKTLIFTVITDPATCYADLLSGAINVAGPECLAPNDYALLTKNPTYHTAQLTSNGYEGIDINVSNGAGYLKPATAANNPLATHADLREALALTLNRKTINRVAFDNSDIPNCGPISPSSVYYTKLNCPSPNIAKAKALVKASGVATPIKLNLMVPTGTVDVEQGEIEATEAAAAGFDISVQQTEFTTALSEADGGDYQLFDIGWSGRVDPDQNITPFFTQGNTNDYTGEGPPALINDLAQALKTSSVVGRRTLYDQAEKVMLQYNGIIFLVSLSNQIASPKSVQGVSFTPDGLVHFAAAGIAKS